MKRIILASVFFLSLFTGLSYSALTYEYLVVRAGVMSSSDKGQTKTINKYAKQGWELYTVSNVSSFTVFYFRRELKK